MDGLPENVPHSGKYAIDLTWQNAGGNHVVVAIGFDLFAFYAHMRPGSITVKEGDVVKVGQSLGHVGNTGSSTEPHLHFHIIDRPQFLSGQGVPYEFANFSTSPRIENSRGSQLRCSQLYGPRRDSAGSERMSARECGTHFPRALTLVALAEGVDQAHVGLQVWLPLHDNVGIKKFRVQVVHANSQRKRP
jgi:murein DD-endopeptidase MepM/ murein hydrolase activator NlpD